MPVVGDAAGREDIFKNGQMGEGFDDLKGATDAEARNHVRGKPVGALSVKGNLPRRGFVDAGDQIEANRFAGAVRTEQPQDFAARISKADAVHGPQTAEVLGETADFEQRAIHGLPPGSNLASTRRAALFSPRSPPGWKRIISRSSMV